MTKSLYILLLILVSIKSFPQKEINIIGKWKINYADLHCIYTHPTKGWVKTICENKGYFLFLSDYSGEIDNQINITCDAFHFSWNFEKDIIAFKFKNGFTSISRVELIGENILRFKFRYCKPHYADRVMHYIVEIEKDE